MPLEIASFTTSSALHSLTATPPPSRIELCQNASVGGLTPSLESYTAIKPATSSLSIPVHIMIRPHATSFVYDEEDLKDMVETIEIFKKAGCEGFVLGCLKEDRGAVKVDGEACRALLDVIGKDKKVTFHRAFDEIPPARMAEELEVLIELGFDAVLTSGGAKSAVAGKEVLKMLVEKARGRLDIIVGGGVRSTNLVELREYLRNEVRWWHSSAVTDGGEKASVAEIEALGKTFVY